MNGCFFRPRVINPVEGWALTIGWDLQLSADSYDYIFGVCSLGNLIPYHVDVAML